MRIFPALLSRTHEHAHTRTHTAVADQRRWKRACSRRSSLPSVSSSTTRTAASTSAGCPCVRVSVFMTVCVSVSTCVCVSMCLCVSHLAPPLQINSFSPSNLKRTKNDTAQGVVRPGGGVAPIHEPELHVGGVLRGCRLRGVCRGGGGEEEEEKEEDLV